MKDLDAEILLVTARTHPASERGLESQRDEYYSEYEDHRPERDSLDSSHDGDPNCNPKRETSMIPSKLKETQSGYSYEKVLNNNQEKRNSQKVNTTRKENHAASNRDSFQYRYDLSGYGDEEDKAILSKLKELDREKLLVERIEGREYAYMLWKAKRGMNKAPRKLSENSGPIQDNPARILRIATKNVKDLIKTGKKIGVYYSGTTESDILMRYEDIVHRDEKGEFCTTELFLSRDNLLEISMQPHFARSVTGLFTRVPSHDHGEEFLMCRILEVSKGQPYRVTEGVYSNWYLTLQSPVQKLKVAIPFTTSSHPTEMEFDTYRDKFNMSVPNSVEVKQMLEHAPGMIHEHKESRTQPQLGEHRSDLELPSGSATTWQTKENEAVTRLTSQKEKLNTAKDAADLKEDSFSKHSGGESSMVLRAVSKRNEEINRIIDKRAGEKRALEAQKASNDGKEENWRTILSVWEPNQKKRKISNRATDRFFDVPLPALDAFQARISETDREGSIVIYVSDENYVSPAQYGDVAIEPPGSKRITLKEWYERREGRN